MGSYKNLNHMKYIQALLFATAYGAGLSLDNDTVTLSGMQSMDGDNLKVELTATLKSGSFNPTIAGGTMMYFLTSSDKFVGKTFSDMEELEGDAGELGADDWGTYVGGGSMAGESDVKGAGVTGSGDNEESYDSDEAGWTGTTTITDTELTVTATRPLSAKPALTEGDEAYHTMTLMYADESAENGMGIQEVAFEATVVGGAATLAAGATLAASLFF